MRDAAAPIADEIDRLERLAAETGDRRFRAAAELLAGAAPTWSSAAIALRRAAVRSMAARFFPTDDPTRQAKAIVSAMRRYLDRGGWTRGQAHAAKLPKVLDGRIEGAIWELWMATEPKIFFWQTLYRDLTD